ncbi:hypothetical protein B0H14DRAFT_3482450 [Mycena olivaceomarginata]|nr:hypothetical protein B0H14DRAFT_3482450 [Mycena olivaceomarginata]
MAPLGTWEVVKEGYSQPSPELVPCFVHPSSLPLRLETGHISYIHLFVGVSPPTPPSAGSLLTGPGATYPGFLD